MIWPTIFFCVLVVYSVAVTAYVMRLSLVIKKLESKERESQLMSSFIPFLKNQIEIMSKGLPNCDNTTITPEPSNDSVIRFNISGKPGGDGSLQ